MYKNEKGLWHINQEQIEVLIKAMKQMNKRSYPSTPAIDDNTLLELQM